MLDTNSIPPFPQAPLGPELARVVLHTNMKGSAAKAGRGGKILVPMPPEVPRETLTFLNSLGEIAHKMGAEPTLMHEIAVDERGHATSAGVIFAGRVELAPKVGASAGDTSISGGAD